MPEKKEYTLTDAPELTKEQQAQEELNIPAYMTQVDLTNPQKKRLSKEFFLEYDAIDSEWKKEGLIEKFDGLDAQYEGQLEQREDMQFNLHKHTTKVKVDTAVRYAKKAFLKSDPIYSVSPRPESTEENINQVCEHQQDYLDYKLDEGEIPFKSPLGKVIHSAANKGVGILKVPHEIKREKCKREEMYKGNPIYIVPMPQQTPQGMQAIPTTMDQEKFKKLEKEKPTLAKYAKIKSNQGLEDFLSAYPEAPEKYKGYVKALSEGKEIRIVVEYEDVTYNDPLPKYVLLQNFRCRLTVDGYEGMKTTKLLSERMNYTWWELKQEEAAGKFFDIDNLKFEYDSKGKVQKNGDKDKEKANYANETFDVFEAVFYFKVDEKDEEFTKLRLWIEEDSKKVIGVTLYPYYGVPCYWVPFYVYDKWAGWLQPSIAEYLTDGNIAEDAFLNFTLEGLWMGNMITPITPAGSTADEQFLEKEWMHGVPINANPKEIDFLQKYMQRMDVGGMVTMMQILTRGADDVSGISSLATGRESEIDPQAPARKTLALLQQSGINIEEYIDNLLSSFNETGKIFLQLTYQMSKEGRKYKPRGKGGNFVEISRKEMITRTNIQSQAMAFNFDELNLKRELLSFYQAFRSDPLLARNPEGLFVIMKLIIKKWSPMTRNIVDEVLPSMQEFKQQQKRIAVEAMAMYVEAKLKDAQTTGVKPEFDLKEIEALMQQAMQEAVTPPSEEVVKQREKEAENAG